MNELLHIADRVLNRPLLIHPVKAEVILHVLEGRLPLDGAPLAPLSPDANRFLGSNARQDGRWGVNKAEAGVAMIPIIGSLVNRGGWIGANSGMTSYEGLSAQLREAASDPEVRAVVLDIDSPGGEATGMFALASQVRALSAVKPVTAFVNDMAASAAYGIASAADEIVVSPTSVVGSIGVVLTHFDRSAQMEKAGVKPTLIYAGRHKVDGNPFGPLSDAVQADLQAEVMRYYEQFVALVAAGRSNLTEESIRATEARTYIGRDAIDRGLADRIATLEDVMSGLTSQPQGASTHAKGKLMSKSHEALAPQAENAGITAEAHAAAVAAARAEGAAAERARIAAIIRSDAADGRTAQAIAMALDTDIAAEAAAKVLSVTPKAAVTPTIAQRAAGEAEFGGDDNAAVSKEAALDRMWSKSVDKMNSSFTNK
jgi:signal peptide peptidase SppA